MNFFDYIRGWFIDATQWFVDAAMWCYFSTLPLDGLGDIFSDLSTWTARVAGYLYDASDWYDWVEEQLEVTLSWDYVRGRILSWLPGIEAAIIWFNNLGDTVLSFVEHPIQWLREKFESRVLPWAIDNIPLFGTLDSWYINFRTELELFFSNPTLYLRKSFEDDLLPWAINNVPLISTLYVIYSKYAGEFGMFLDDPILWLRSKFEDDILPWAKESIPFFSALAVLVDTITDLEFFADPLQWLYNKMDEWFERFW